MPEARVILYAALTESINAITDTGEAIMVTAMGIVIMYKHMYWYTLDMFSYTGTRSM